MKDECNFKFNYLYSHELKLGEREKRKIDLYSIAGLYWFSLFTSFLSRKEFRSYRQSIT